MAGPGKPKTGGRAKGTTNQRTKMLADKIASSGLTPLEYLTQVYRDAKLDRAVRMDAAKACLPYIHPRLQTTEVKAQVEGKLIVNLVNFGADD